MAMAVAILLGPNANVAFLVALAFAVAASANLPVIVLSLFWKRFTTRGAVCGLGTGLVASILLIVIGPSIMGVDAPGATGLQERRRAHLVATIHLGAFRDQSVYFGQIPAPRRIQPESGEFRLDRTTRIMLSDPASAELHALVELLAVPMRAVSGLPLPVSAEPADERHGLPIDAGLRLFSERAPERRL